MCAGGTKVITGVDGERDGVCFTQVCSSAWSQAKYVPRVNGGDSPPQHGVGHQAYKDLHALVQAVARGVRGRTRVECVSEK